MYEKKDAYYRKSKEEGYRARSAYKLKQINNKFRIIKKGSTVLDIGASPGGWSQVASSIVGPEGRVIAVDKEWMDPLKNENFTFIQGDITDESTIDNIIGNVGNIDALISDIAPKTTGIIDIDRSRSAILSMMALDIGKRLLKPKGNFLTKVFQSQESEELFSEMKNCFSYTKRFRPPSTRKRSSEIYLIGKNYFEENI
ncbi:MAG TPA: RlmE family RNA methyltransferase [Candidatus Methanofastidiosa archaeon]|nr:RlmE family RNA methyltransferase [Candidatus Methanofastidiosa archaeon]